MKFIEHVFKVHRLHFTFCPRRVSHGADRMFESGEKKHLMIAEQEIY